MANSYWNFVSRMVSGTLAKADDVNTQFDGVTAGFTLVETAIDTINLTKTKVVDIGDWNMDSDISVNPAHGLTLADIRDVSVIIRNDADTHRYSISHDAAGIAQGRWFITATTLDLSRTLSGFFDSINFDSTSYNRGWITITYV